MVNFNHEYNKSKKRIKSIIETNIRKIRVIRNGRNDDIKIEAKRYINLINKKVHTVIGRDMGMATADNEEMDLDLSDTKCRNYILQATREIQSDIDEFIEEIRG